RAGRAGQLGRGHARLVHAVRDQRRRRAERRGDRPGALSRMRASSRAGVLAGLLVACAASAAWSAAAAAASPSGRYRVTLRPLAEPIALNTWHAWLLHIERADGAALALRDLAVDGGMPAHGHGLPSAPRLERGPSANDFVVQGLRFSMAGRWELRVLIADHEGSEVVA